MSIITQALKKAQHEQRLQQSQRTQYGSLSPFRPQAPRPRTSRHTAGWIIAAGVTLLFGAGIISYMQPFGRQAGPGSLPIAMTAPAVQQPISESETVLGPSILAPSTQALERPQPELLSPAAPPPRYEVAGLTPITPPARRTLPTQRVPSGNTPLAPVPSAVLKPKISSPKIKSPQRPPQAQQRFDSGIEAYNAGKLDEAEVFLQQALALDPTLKRAFNSLGNLYYQRQAYEQALEMYQKALALDPDYIKARNNLGNTYMQLDMSFKAISELTKAILVDSESGLTYYNMACVYARTSEPDKAIRYLEMAIAREPEARHWAKTDTDFTAVRSNSAFQKLLGTSS